MKPNKMNRKKRREEDWPSWMRDNQYGNANIISWPALIPANAPFREDIVELLWGRKIEETGPGKTPAVERRCVADVMKKQGYDMSRAFAICRSSMQKAHNYKAHSMELTKKGAAKSAAKDKAKDDPAKARYFEKAVKAARKD